MRHTTIATLSLLLFMFHQFAFAADNILIGKGVNTISINPNTASDCIVTSTERYERNFLFQYDQNKNDYYLVTQRFEVGEGCFEGFDPASVSLTAKKINVRTGKSSSKKSWSFSTKGISGERENYPMNGIYKVRYPGCCGALDTFKYFSLYTGNMLGAAYLKPLVLEIPNEHKFRFIFLQDDNASEFLGKGGQITVFYSDKESIKQQLFITVSNAPDPFYCDVNLRFDDKEGEMYELWNKSEFDGLPIVIKINCGTGTSIISIPVVSDKLSIDKAVITGALDIKLQ